MLPSPSLLACLGTVPTHKANLWFWRKRAPFSSLLGQLGGRVNQSTDPEGPELFWHVGKGLEPDGASIFQNFREGEIALIYQGP